MEILAWINDIFSYLLSVSHNLCFLLAFLVGCVSAFAELLSRYREGFKILRYKEAMLYLFINGICAVIAYFVIINYKFELGPFAKGEIGKALTAGFASMFILRSSFASIKNGEKTLDVGFAPILQVFLNTIDRAFDQRRSKNNIQEVGKIMKGVKFVTANNALPLLCISAMQNLSQKEQNSIAKEIGDIADQSIPDDIKALNLGIVLSRYTDTPLLESIVNVFQEAVSAEPLKGQDKALSIQEQKEKIKTIKQKFYTLSKNKGEEYGKKS